jgi:hypothetical protein
MKNASLGIGLIGSDKQGTFLRGLRSLQYIEESQLHIIGFPFRNKCNFFECIFLFRFSISSISTCVKICILCYKTTRQVFEQIEDIKIKCVSQLWLILGVTFSSVLILVVILSSVAYRYRVSMKRITIT